MKPGDLVFPQSTVLGKWKIGEKLGGGGQGSVWLAKPTSSKHSPVRALKVCIADDAQGRARFEREVELLLRCDSPHVLKLFDHDLVWKEHVAGLPPLAYYVSERHRGSLVSRQRELGDARRRLALFKHACAALSYLHTLPEPLLHRDVKPDNFFIAGEFENLVLGDFGIARPAMDSGLTAAFEAVGTPHFRAPEVANYERGSVQSDVYGLGRLLEWLLTGDVSRDLGTRTVSRGQELDDDACDALERLIAKATQVSPNNRFASVQDLADQLPVLWLAVKPRAEAAPSVAVRDGVGVFNAALELVRSNDGVGLRRLEQHVRRDCVERALLWRAEHERQAPHLTQASAPVMASSLLEVFEPRLALVFADVYARRVSSGLAQAVEDLAAIPGWPSGGYTVLIDAPRTLIYLTHYILGAFCLVDRRTDEALRIAEVIVPTSRKGESVPLWQQHDLTGYPGLFNETARWGWDYLCGLWGSRPLIRDMFALQDDFEVGLASYSSLLSLIELASDVGGPNAPTEHSLSGPHVRLTVAPLVMQMKHDTIAAAARRTSGDGRVVQAIATHYRADVVTMKRLWPVWKQLMSKYRRSDGIWFGDLPIGDLA